MDTNIFNVSKILLLVVFTVVLCLVQKRKMNSPVRVIGGLAVISLLVFCMNYLFLIVVSYIGNYIDDGLSEQMNILYYAMEALAAVIIEIIIILGCCYLYKGVSGEKEGVFKILLSQPAKWKAALLAIVILEGVFSFLYQNMMFDKMLSGGFAMQLTYYQIYQGVRLVISLMIVTIETVACIGKMKGKES